MLKKVVTSVFSCLLCSALCPAIAQNDLETPKLHITPNLIGELDKVEYDLENFPGQAVVDSGSFISLLPGVDAGRMGGHGLEPVIHGQQNTQINVTDSGAFIHGGCPNRMDPPSSALPFKLYDKLAVDYGYQTVTKGSNGSGGSITFTRTMPQKELEGRAGFDFGSNGSAISSFADIAHRGESFFQRGSGQYTSSGNYSDGNGNEVRSKFSQISSIVDVGGGSETEDYIHASLLTSRTNDAVFEGATMDEPETSVIMPKLAAQLALPDSKIARLYFRGYASVVDHLMDNYSLRQQSGMLMRTPTASNSFGATIGGVIPAASYTVDSGIDVQIIDRKARRYSGMMRDNVNTLSSILWPDLVMTDVGIFSELSTYFGENGTLTFGARVDAVHYDADSAGEEYSLPTGMTMTPNDLYRRYYGESFESQTEVSPSSFMRYEHRLSKLLEGSATVGYVTRFADSTEKALASQSMKGSWFGNPGIEPEKHYQAQSGLAYGDEYKNISGSAFADLAHEYILKDTARGQNGILVTDGSTIYRNIDAVLSGLLLQMTWQFIPEISLSNTVSYTYGQDIDSGRPLPQIPPISGTSTLSYVLESISSGIRLHYASTQNRVDSDPLTGTGRDVGDTSGYGIWDMFLSYEFMPTLEFSVSLQNVGDKNYANHLNRTNAFDPLEVRVNEPGRSVFFSLSGKIAGL